MKKLLTLIALIATMIVATTLTAFAADANGWTDANGFFKEDGTRNILKIKRNIPASEAPSEGYEIAKASGEVAEIIAVMKDNHTYYAYLAKTEVVDGIQVYDMIILDPATGYYNHGSYADNTIKNDNIVSGVDGFVNRIKVTPESLSKVSVPNAAPATASAPTASPVATTAPASSDINVVVNDTAVKFAGQGPIVQNGTTLVPVRGVFEQLGFTVSWDNGTKTATLANDQDTVVITVGKTTFTANGKTMTPSVPAQTINGSTMLPLRAICESIGSEVNWDNATKTATISYAK